MYRIYLDGNPLFFTGSEDLKLRSAKLDLELNRFGNFTFTISKENQMYSRIRKKESLVTIYDDKKYIFGGRVLDAKKNFFGDYTVTCEGKIGYLKDSVVRPYEFKGSVVDYFSMLITQHNNQVGDSYKFFVGNVTVTDPNDLIVRANSNYPDTWREIEDKLIKKLGGYVVLRQEGTAAYLDYLKDSEYINDQEIHFGKNLLENEFEESIKGKDIYTCIIPLGAKLKDSEGNETEERLTIKDVNGGLDYVQDNAAVEKYGKIYKVITVDDVTVADNLLAKARKELQNTINLIQTVKLSAVDLHSLNANIKSFELFKYTKVVSPYHGLNKVFLTRKLTLDLLDPTKGYLTLGDEKRTFVDKTVDTSNNVDGIIIENAKPGPPGKDGVDGNKTIYLDMPGKLTREQFYKYSEPNTKWVWNNIKNVADVQLNDIGIVSGIIVNTNEKWSIYGDVYSVDVPNQKVGIVSRSGTIDGKDANEMFISNQPPTDKSLRWCDTSTDPPVLKEWNGNAWVAVPDQSNVINLLYKTVYKRLEETENGIKQTIGEQVYTKTETDKKITSDISTSVEQTKNSFNFEFDQFRQDLNTSNTDTNNKFEEIHKYIRFVDGVIYIGIEGNPLVLKLANDRISFLENGAEVMYINEQKLFITNVEITNTLRIGKLAFVPRENGNLSLKRVN